MKILFHHPAPTSIYAGRTIYYGYKHAFEDLGHTFRSLTPDDNMQSAFMEYAPDIFFTSIGPLHFKYLNFDLVKEQKKRGMKIFVNTPFWKSPFSKLRINETSSISENQTWVTLIKSHNFGDVYFNICEQGDPRMEGMEKETGYKPQTIILAADNTIPVPQFSSQFASDLSFIGTFLPGKRSFFNEYVFPLKEKYNVKLYGRDWTSVDRFLNFAHRIGQYFNIPYLKSFKKYKPTLEEERIIHHSSTIALNIHEDYQKQGLGDINERTFKIPHSNGFEIVDNVPSLPKYFKDGTELVIAKSKKDWFEKIEYYLKNPEKRLPIIKAGHERVLREHTYHHRVEQILQIYKTLH